METIHILQQSSLEKIFLDATEFKPDYTGASVLRGEEFAYQIVLKTESWGKGFCNFKIDSPFGDNLQVYQVKSVPSEVAAYPAPGHDDDYLSLKPGLYPDLLCPVEKRVELSSFINTVLWVNITVPEDFAAGEHAVKFTVESGEAKAESTFTLRVIPAVLPKQRLLFTEWFYADCLADWYKVPVYSEEHWEIIGNYLREAAAGGINTILTPIMTPALDTAVGTERPCVQLIDIEKNGNSYTFGFSKVRRFVELALECGMTHFEISHLFTQWGAEFTPAVYAVENGERRRIFGWDVAADAPEYIEFLKQFLPAVVKFFRGMGLEDRVMFHISDEPHADHLERYRRNKEFVSELIDGLPIMDALSSPVYYDEGVVKCPVASIDHIEPFLERKVPELWAYNCCGQSVKVSNRFMSMPSYRNRIIGLQLYKYNIKGFLHWGYNFWNAQVSLYRINPFLTTDAGDGFPSGDPFAVYPGENGKPLPSLRLKTFNHGLQDERALELLESLAGRETVEAAVPEYSDITFSEYPRSAEYLLEMREKINVLIEQHCQS